jgi:hypothetical protein
MDVEKKFSLRKPAARRSDCIGNRSYLLQTGRGAALKLVLFGELDQQVIKAP